MQMGRTEGTQLPIEDKQCLAFRIFYKSSNSKFIVQVNCNFATSPHSSLPIPTGDLRTQMLATEVERWP